MKKYYIILLILSAFADKLVAQGCVAIRSTGGMCNGDMSEHVSTEKWSLNINNRYFKSYRHFIGTREQKQRVQLGTEVINHSYTMDILLIRNFSPRWSMAFNLPIVSNSRSSLYEHDGKTRHSTHSFGLGDTRISGYAWLWNPVEKRKGNIQIGLGLKLPTGDYKFQDFFYKNDTLKVLGPVDQSIQPGDGGLGFSIEANGFISIFPRWNIYGNMFYLLSPREQNGTSTARGGTPSNTSVLYGSSTMSVPDQYMLRGGLTYTGKKGTFSLGLRDECLPSKDLVGGSSGFRRPGYIISLEPGVSWRNKNLTVYSNVPYALKRSRTQSYSDKARTKATGMYTQGDAAFADYVVNIGARLGF